MKVGEEAMAYTYEKPKLSRDSETLKQTIPGWGVDLDPKNRPAVPMENLDLKATGAHWSFPERQIQRYPREKSTEHKFLTPVFGTVCPPRGISGLVRRSAYKFSEGRTAHWLLLILGDRIDVFESKVIDLLRGRLPHPIADRGLRAELKRHGIRSRIGQHRADLVHQPIDVMIFLAKTAALGLGIFALANAVRPKRRRGLLARLRA